jgi:hypothetical protein
VEAPTPSARRVLWARVALRLAGDTSEDHRAALEGLDGVFRGHLAELWWRNRVDLAASIALAPERFPAGWGEAARAAIVARAGDWLEGVQTLPYARAWYATSHRYFGLNGWGNDTYVPVRDLALAWRVTGERIYRDAALSGLSYLHGGNPLGRVHVTGLGAHFAATALHLPSFVDGLDEPAPGLALYGVIAGVPYAARSRVYGIEQDARADPPFEGHRAVWLPPELAAGVADFDALGPALATWLPAWRRFVQLESQVVPSMEFAVADTQTVAILATGLLMSPGFTPPSSLPPPRDAAALQSARRVMP